MPHDCGRADPRDVDASDQSAGQDGRSHPELPSALEQIRVHAPELRSAFAALGAHDIRVFGSVARGEESDASDVDLLVDLEPGRGLFVLPRLQRAAEALLGCHVDVIPANGERTELVERLLREAIPL